MKKKPPPVSKKAPPPAKTKPDGLTTLVTEVRQLIQSARRGVSTVVDTFQVMTNFEIGRRIVEYEQKGVRERVFARESVSHEAVLPGMAGEGPDFPAAYWEIGASPDWSVEVAGLHGIQTSCSHLKRASQLPGQGTPQNIVVVADDANCSLHGFGGKKIVRWEILRLSPAPGAMPDRNPDPGVETCRTY